MITLISKWKLKNGCPPALVEALKCVAEQVEANEPDTLMYTVHLPALSPVDPAGSPLVPSPAPIASEQQTEVVFFEIYRDAKAFAYHLNGPTFTQFRTEYIKYFYQDPQKSGWPNTETEFLQRQSAFVRPDGVQHI